jgi:SAM-dependent methyltransferase
MDHQASAKDILPNDWDTFIKHLWYAGTPEKLEDWPTVKRCEETGGLLHEFGCRSILDVAAAYGMKTLQFKRLGFDATGIDFVERAAELGKELAERHGMEVDFHHMSWAEAPSYFREEFDAVYNDNFPNATSAKELREAAIAAFAALKLGGIALFGSRSEEEWRMTPGERVESAWKGNDPQIWCSLETPEGHVTTLHMSERFPMGIYHHFLHLMDRRKLEHSGYYQNLQWGLDDCISLMKKVGFSSAELQKLPSGDYEGVAIK